MRFVFHIGIHKTGTSSIQAFCAQNRKLLLEKGILYPTNKYTSRSFNFLAARIAFGDLDEPRTFLKRAVEKGVRKGANTILISAESFYAMHAFFFRLYDRPHGDYWAAEKNAIENFRACLPPGDVRILCYLRPQDRELEAVYNQCVKHETGFSGSIADFLPLMEEMLDYAGHLDLWAKSFGAENIVVRSYSQAADRLISDFLEASVGIEDVAGFRPAKENGNTRLNRDILEYKRILNKIPVPRHEAFLNMRALWAISERLGDVHSHQQYLSPEARIRLVEKYARGNARLQERFLRPGMHPLFPALKAPDPRAPAHVAWSPYPGLSVEKAIEILYHHEKIKRSFSFRAESLARRSAQALRQRSPAFEEVLHLVRRLRRFKTKHSP